MFVDFGKTDLVSCQLRQSVLNDAVLDSGVSELSTQFGIVRYGDALAFFIFSASCATISCFSLRTAAFGKSVTS